LRRKKRRKRKGGKILCINQKKRGKVLAEGEKGEKMKVKLFFD